MTSTKCSESLVLLSELSAAVADLDARKTVYLEAVAAGASAFEDDVLYGLVLHARAHVQSFAAKLAAL